MNYYQACPQVLESVRTRAARIRFMLAMRALICSLSVAGCIHAPAYPEHWVPLAQIKTTECSMFKGCWCGALANSYLTGSYQDAGEIVPKQEGGAAFVSLAHLIFTERDLARTVPVEYVTFRGPENKLLEISAWNRNDLIVTKRLRERTIWDDFHTRDLFDCQAGGVRINVSMVGGGAVIALGGSTTSTQLDKAKDGALIAKHEDSMAGIILLLPYAKYEHQWYRFAPAP